MTRSTSSLALAALVTLAGAASADTPDIREIVRKWNAAPATGGQFTQLGIPTIGPDGRVAFSGTSNGFLGPTGMHVDSASGLVTWVPGSSALGSHSVTVRATDAAGNVDATPAKANFKVKAAKSKKKE